MVSDNTPGVANPADLQSKYQTLSAREHEVTRVAHWSSIGSMALIGASFLVAAPVAITATVVSGIGLGIASVFASMRAADIRREREALDVPPVVVVADPKSMEPASPCQRADGKSWAAGLKPGCGEKQR